jgi:hypothetical protein
MEKLKGVDLIIGCGKQGAYWSARADRVTIPLDHQTLTHPPKNFTIGDILALPFVGNSIDRIYADFVLNAVEMRGATMKEAISCPELLADESRPEQVRHWFIENLGKSPEKFKDNMKDLRWILRGISLAEMWRAIKTHGTITIVDHGHIVKWIEANKSQIFQDNSDQANIQMANLEDEDFRRSGSLEKIYRDGATIGKLVIRKR